MPRQFISQIRVPDNEQAYDIKAYQSAGIYYAAVDSTSTSTAYTVTIPELTVTEYYDGLTILLYNGKVTSASGFTINVNGLGALPSYSNMSLGNSVTPTDPTRDTTIFNINYAMLFTYNSTRVSGGCWICYRGYDSNSNTIGYQVRTNNTTLKASDKFYRYRLLFTSADGTKWVPANTSTSTNATAKRDAIQTPIDPFGEIVWYGTTTAIEANANVTAAQLWQQYYSSYTNIGYSFNTTGAAATMTANLPIYIKCTPQANGSAIIYASQPYVQTLPSTEDGYIYILLGRAYNATNFEILLNHPIYYYKDGSIRVWTNAESGLPNVSASDNGKLLTVVNGGWAPATKPSYTANEVGALPSNTTYVSSVNGQSGVVTVATPGTLNTTATTAQTPNASESLGGTVTLHKVAKTGMYSDLIGTPNLATVATSGSYTDLTNKPTIPDNVYLLPYGTVDATDFIAAMNAGKTVFLVNSGSDSCRVGILGNYYNVGARFYGFDESGVEVEYTISINEQNNSATWTRLVYNIHDFELVTTNNDLSDVLTIINNSQLPVFYDNGMIGQLVGAGQYSAFFLSMAVVNGECLIYTYKVDEDGWTTSDFTVQSKIDANNPLSASLVSGLATVATSGNYNDLTNKPTLGTAAAKDTTNTYSATGTDPITGTGVAAALATLPTPMQFKGTVGSSGTIEWSALPTAAAGNTGYVYKVISDHSTAPVCKNGDTIVSNGSSWVVIPSGDEPSGTVTSVAVSNGGGLSVSGSPITSSGTITISHSDTSSQASVSNSGRTYIQSVTLDTYGHVTGLSSATETVTDTNTTYTLNVSGTGDNATKVGLVAGGSGSGTNWYTIPYATSAGTANSVAWANVSGHAAGVKADIGIATSGSTFLRKDGSWVTPTDTNTTYALSGALSSHKFTSTLTAGGSGSGTSTTDLTLAAGSNVTLTDDTSNRKITIAATDTNTTYSLAVNGTGDNANKLGLTAGGSGSGTVWVTVPYATTAGSAPSEFVFTDFTVGA